MTVILDASLEIRSAVVYATLIVVLAISPVFFMGGLSGAFLRPLAFAYVLALLASMVVALTVTPALSLILLSEAPPEQREPLARPTATGELREASLRESFALRAWPSSPPAWWCCSALRPCPCSASRCCPRSRSATS